MSDAPRLSVIIPMYNSGKFLAATVESILAQTMRDFELILIDDGSTDGTLEIATDFANRDPRVRLVVNPHTGIAGARNNGLAATDKRAEFITFFDHDDLWEQDSAAKLVAALDSNPHAPAAHGVCRCIDIHGIQFPDDNHAERMRNRRAVVGDGIISIPRSSPTGFGALLVENYVTTPGTSMVRRSVLQAVGEYDASVVPCDDWDMNLRLARLGDLVFVDEILLSWRRHSMASSNSSKRWRRAYLNTRYKSIYAPEGTAEQRRLARTALRAEIRSVGKDAVGGLFRGEFLSTPKKVARLLLLVLVDRGWYGRA